MINQAEAEARARVLADVRGIFVVREQGQTDQGNPRQRRQALRTLKATRSAAEAADVAVPPVVP
jgi:hypothetical protein